MKNNPKLKKILFIIIVLCTFTCMLASCNINKDEATYEKNIWYTSEKLELCLVEDLTEISDVEYLKVNDNSIHAQMNDEQLKKYASEVFEYLKEKEFTYFGTRGDWINNNFFNYYVYHFKTAEMLEDCIYTEYYDDSLYEFSYIFVYSDGSLDEEGNVIFNIVKIDKYKEEGTITYGDEVFKSNIKLTIYHDSEPKVSYKL